MLFDCSAASSGIGRARAHQPVPETSATLFRTLHVNPQAPIDSAGERYSLRGLVSKTFTIAAAVPVRDLMNDPQSLESKRPPLRRALKSLVFSLVWSLADQLSRPLRHSPSHGPSASPRS